MPRLPVLPVILLLLLPALARAGEGPRLEDQAWLEDPGGALTAEAVAALPAARFRPLDGTVGAGFSTAPRWIRFTAVNPSAGPVRGALVFRFPMVEHLDLFLAGPGGLDRHRGGLAVPEPERELAFEDGGHAFDVTLAPGERRAGLLRVQTSGAGFMGLALVPERQHHRLALVALLAHLGLGALLALVLLAARYAAASRRREDRYAVAFLAGQTLHVLIASGTFSAIWEAPPGALLVLKSAVGVLSAGAGCFFVEAFLETRERSPRLASALRAAGWLSLATAPAVLLSPTTGNDLIAVAGLISLTAGAAAAVEALAARLRVMPLVMPGLVVFALATGWYLLSLLGLVRPSPLVVLAEITGVAATAVATLLARAQTDWWDAGARQDRLGLAVAERTATLSLTEDALRAEEAERRRAEERFRLAFELFPDAVSISRLEDGVILAANPGFLDLHGLPLAQVLGRSTMELGLWGSGDRGEYAERLRRDGAVRELELRLRLRTGAERALVLNSCLLTAGGEALVLASARDVTAQRATEAERARLQDGLRQAQKLEAVGRLAAGVAHDFNNLLAALRADLAAALDELPPGSDARDPLEDAGRTVRRATDLTRQLLSFSRRDAAQPRPVALDDLVHGMERLLARLVGEAVHLDLRLARGLPVVQADPGQLEQVILNLVINARDAVGPGGHILVEAAALERPAGADRPAGRWVRLAVVDDGAGMDEATRQRIFEPFFTTKPAGQGTGLGLATVYGVVQQHGGFLEVQSAPGRGSTFEVFLPVPTSGLRLVAGDGGTRGAA